MAAAPAIVQFVGGTPADATENSAGCARSPSARTRRSASRRSTSARRRRGVDARLVLDSGVLPVINTGIAHREAGVGQIGAGITTAPMDCFVGAIDALAAARSEAAP